MFTKMHLAVHNIKEKEGESTRAFATRYTDDTLQIWGLHEDHRISGFVHGLRIRSLVEHLSMDIPYKGLMDKTYTWIEAREVATNEALNDQKENFERLKKSSWDNNRGQKGRDSFSPTEDLITNYSSVCPKAQERSLLQKSQIKEVVKSGQLSHLVKGIKEERSKSSKNQRVEGKKDKGVAPTEAPLLMINQEESYTRDNASKNFILEGREITFPSVTRGINSSTPIIIKAKIFGGEVGRVHIDSGSSCEVIYEHCFMKLKPSIRASKINSKVPLIGFSGKKSWSSGEIPLEITIGRTSMQKIGIVVSTIYVAMKFHTAKGIGTVFSTHESNKIKE
nr:hypothetical protein [Tanacetum cinerariifolium]